MIVLGMDPGAIRCGWACLEKEGEDLSVKDSGTLGLERQPQEKYQAYKLRLIQFWLKEGRLLLNHKPTRLVTEIVPAVGGGNFVVATQSQLAAVVVTVVQVLAYQQNIPVVQVSANTVKKRIGGKHNASKAMVRKGVQEIMPETKSKDKEWKKTSDESDAFAVALTDLGYKRG